jgi:hypothetical protein
MSPTKRDLPPERKARTALILASALASAFAARSLCAEGGLIFSGRAWANAGALASWAEGAEPGAAEYGYSGETGFRLNVVNADRSVIRFDAQAEARLLAGAAAEPALASLDALSAALRAS